MQACQFTTEIGRVSRIDVVVMLNALLTSTFSDGQGRKDSQPKALEPKDKVA